jgi:hypothetical protein
VILAVDRTDVEMLVLISAGAIVAGLLITYLVTWRWRPGPSAAFVWRYLYPALLAGLAVATVMLGVSGTRLVLDSRDGKLVKIVHNPELPGYYAQVASTPTLLVLQVSSRNELVSAAVFSLSANDVGGWALFFPAELIVPVSKGTAALDKIYAQYGADGPGGIRPVLAKLLDADFDSVVNLKADTMASLIVPVAPLQYTLLDAVRIANGKSTSTLLPKGPVRITTQSDIVNATEIIGRDEATTTRFTRQVQFWTAWIGAVRAAPDKAAAFPASSESTELVRFIRGLASNPDSRIEQATFTEQPFNGSILYIGDVTKIKSVAASMIPYPLPYEAGARVRVDVRNGVGNFDLNEPMNRKLVAAGAQIIVLGNADTFTVGQTSVVYYDEAMKPRADALARAIKATDVRFEERLDSSVDVTVTIGADFVP